MDPLNGDVFSPADRGTYRPRRKPNRYCDACARETREAGLAKFAAGLLAGFVIAAGISGLLGPLC